MILLTSIKRLVPILGIGLLCTSPLLFAASFTVKSVAYKGTVPFVQSGNAKLDARINNLIYLDMLELPAPLKLEDGLKEKKEEGPPSMSDIGFEVVRNDSRILALAVSAEGCGAYCEGFQLFYNFDASTGRRITAADLFTPAGAVLLAKRNTAQRVVELNAEIARLKKAEAARQKSAGAVNKGSAKPQDDDDNVQDAIDMYTRCVEFKTSKETVKYQTLAVDSMKIGADKVTFIHGRCSNHAMQALDNLGEQENPYPFKELAPHLSEYGKYLLLDTGKAPAPTGPFNQVLRGSVGQAPVTLMLGAPAEDASINGVYYYDKYRLPIRLRGRVSGNAIELEETESADTPKPVIRATFNGEALQGQWTGKKRIEFKAAP